MLNILNALTWIEQQAVSLGLDSAYVEKALVLAFADLRAGKTKELIWDELKLLFSTVQVNTP